MVTISREHNLTEGNILKSLITFAFPVLLSLFLQAMYGAVDLLVVGKFAGTPEQSGVATGSQVIHMVTMVVTGISMGVTVFVGENIGAGKPEEAGRGIGAGICIFAVIAAAVTAFMAPCSGFLAGVMRAPAEALGETSAYIRICGIGTVFIVAYNILGAIFRGLGDSKTPLITVAIACVINIFGDLLLCAVFKMGAAGAAIATVAAQAVSVLASLFIIKRKKLPFTFSRSSIAFRGEYVKKILKVGIPSRFRSFWCRSPSCSFR